MLTLSPRATPCAAQARGLYSNKLGFLGGVNFAIMVAHVAVETQSTSAATIAEQFFLRFAAWKWPNPLMLCDIEHVEGLEHLVSGPPPLHAHAHTRSTHAVTCPRRGDVLKARVAPRRPGASV